MGRKPSVNLNLPEGMRARVRKSGTYYYLDTGGSPRKEIPLGKDYVMAVQEWARLSAASPPGELITFRYAAERYLAEVLPTKAPMTQKDNLRELAQLYKFFDEPPAPLAEIDPVHISLYKDFRKAAPVRANREKALFSHIWNFARSKGLTNRENPCRGVKGNKETGRDIYIDDETYKAVWCHAEQPLQDAMDLAYMTGQRPADTLKIKRADIIAGYLSIKQNKGGKKLRIEIAGEFASLIERLVQRKSFGTALINNADGYPLTKCELRGAFDRARDAAVMAHPAIREKIRAFQFRDLRAKAATDKDDAQGIKAAQAQLGHSSEAMTAHYVRNRLGKKVTSTKS
jgi:integrase